MSASLLHLTADLLRSARYADLPFLACWCSSGTVAHGEGMAAFAHAGEASRARAPGAGPTRAGFNHPPASSRSDGSRNLIGDPAGELRRAVTEHSPAPYSCRSDSFVHRVAERWTRCFFRRGRVGTHHGELPEILIDGPGPTRQCGGHGSVPLRHCNGSNIDRMMWTRIVSAYPPQRSRCGDLPLIEQRRAVPISRRPSTSDNSKSSRSTPRWRPLRAYGDWSGAGGLWCVRRRERAQGIALRRLFAAEPAACATVTPSLHLSAPRTPTTLNPQTLPRPGVACGSR
jgi:hypothetical protein